MFRQHPDSRVINKSGSIISEIAIETSPYKKCNIIIYFTEGANIETITTLQMMLKEISGDDAYWHHVYSVINGSKSRQVVDKLFQFEQISASDRADIEEDVRKTEIDLGYQQKTVSNTEKSQQDIIEELILPYLEGIVATSPDHRKVFTLLQYAFSRNFQWEINEILGLIKSCGKYNDACKETFGCIQHLKRVCWGEANLESTCQRLGAEVPSLAKQREIVADACLKILSNKFQLTVEDRFFYSTEILMMTCITQRNIYTSYTRNFLEKILNNQVEQRDIFLAFVYLGGFDTVLYKGLLKAKLNKDERQILIDKLQNKVLSDSICRYFPSECYQTHFSLFAINNTASTSASDTHCGDYLSNPRTSQQLNGQ